jgi:hypothetical protein
MGFLCMRLDCSFTEAVIPSENNNSVLNKSFPLLYSFSLELYLFCSSLSYVNFLCLTNTLLLLL